MFKVVAVRGKFNKFAYKAQSTGGIVFVCKYYYRSLLKDHTELTYWAEVGPRYTAAGTIIRASPKNLWHYAETLWNVRVSLPEERTGQRPSWTTHANNRTEPIRNTITGDGPSSNNSIELQSWTIHRQICSKRVNMAPGLLRCADPCVYAAHTILYLSTYVLSTYINTPNIVSRFWLPMHTHNITAWLNYLKGSISALPDRLAIQ